MINKTNKLLLTAAIAAVLTGCSTADKNTAPPPKPAPVAKVASPPPKVMMALAPTYIIEDVHFDFDKANLKPSAAAVLDEVASGLLDQSTVPYEVGGHTDSIGSVRYNQGLSERRAASVHSYLMDRGVDPSRLMQRGYSESQPIASNATKEGRAQNRRVEVKPL